MYKKSGKKAIFVSMKRVLFLIVLLSALPAAGQKKDSFWRDWNDFLDMRADKAYAKTDTTYVGRYPYIWDARLFDQATGLYFVSTFGGDIHLSSGICNRAGVGLSYRGLGLNFSHALGKRRSHDLALSSYGRHFGFEFALRATNDLTGSVEMSGVDAAGLKDKIDNLYLISNKLNLLYSFNPRFSYGAAMKQTKIQRRSAGSFIAELSWSVWDMLFLEETERTLDSFYEANYFYQRFSIGAGYGYNLVLGQQHWLLHASLIPMWTFYEMLGWRKDGKRERVNYPYGKIAYAGSAHVGVYYRWGTRWSLGFSSVVNQMASSAHFSSKASGFQRFGGQEWQAILSLGCRF